MRELPSCLEALFSLATGPVEREKQVGKLCNTKGSKSKLSLVKTFQNDELTL